MWKSGGKALLPVRRGGMIVLSLDNPVIFQGESDSLTEVKKDLRRTPQGR